jgi:hypothetical protein
MYNLRYFFNKIITFFRSITMFHKTDNIMWNVSHVKYECEEYIHIILPVARNIVMDLNNVMMMDQNDVF